MNQFTEHSLREAIVAMWGEYGAHADVYDRLLVEVTRLRGALKDIAGQDPVELALDPQWSQRIARAALDGGTPVPSGEEA